MTEWKLLGDRVLIAPDAAQAKSDGGIHLVNNLAPPEGTVIKVGPGYDHTPIVKVGDKVSYGPSAGTPVLLDKKEYLMLRELEIFMYKRNE